MIYIIKNQTNSVSLTLNELVTTTPFDVLFVCINDTTGLSKTFTAIDTSTSTGRYNKYDIVDTSVEDFYNGKVNFDEGYWTYTVYEMPQSSPPSLNVNNAIKVLEIGKLLARDNIGSSDVTFKLNDNKNNVVFD